MLTHPTLDQLHQLGLLGMAKAFGDVEASGEAAALTHPEWLALLLDREMTYRHDKKPDKLDIMTCSLDDANASPPTFHVWASHKPTWTVIGDGLPVFATTRTES